MTLNDKFEESYSYIPVMAGTFGILGALGIFISCLGLIGLASYNVGRRTKEIGVRKVLGATVSGITKMLISETFVLIVIANVIAWPVTYFLVNKFLQYSWAYTTGVALRFFVYAGVLVLAPSLTAVILLVLKAARANPVDSLRYE